MAWTFGGVNNSRMVTSIFANIGNTQSMSLICGWWYPTTLTAGRAYWSSGPTVSARVAATTSEMTLHTDNTTDGQWTTSGAAIAVNEWKFLAFMLTCFNTGPAAAWRVWVGKNDTVPTEVTVTLNTAPVGNFTGGTTIIMGQLGTSGTVAFQGDIGDYVGISQSPVTVGRGPLGLAAFGAITQDEADNALNRLVIPIWKGDPFPEQAFQQDFTSTGGGFTAFQPMGVNPAAGQNEIPSLRLTTQLNGTIYAGNSVAGAPVKSAARCPRSMSALSNVHRGFRRR